MPITVAPTSASARTKCRWVGGKAGSTKTTFTGAAAVASGCMVVAAFVAPFLMPATVRFVAHGGAAARRAAGPGHHRAPPSRCPPELARHLAGHWRVDDALDPRQIADAVRGLSRQLGPVERLVGALEQLQVPLAQVREALGIPGMDVGTARNVRDKSRMKEVLHAAGVPCARHQLVRAPDEALAFAAAVGFPLVAKPPAGAGAQATYRLDDADALRSWLAAVPPRPEAPGLLEEFLVGEEYTFDSVQIGGTTVWASISDYRPPPLDVLRNPWIQWTVLLPRELDDPRYPEIFDVGPAAVRALGVRDGLTHMEWFRRPDGSVAVSEVGARPPGAQLASMLGLRARRRLLPDVVRAGDPRPVRPAGAEVRGGLRLPARAGPGPGAGRARRRRAAAPARAPGRGGEAARAGPARVVGLRGRGLRDRARPGHRGGRATRWRRSSDGIRVELVEAQ